jgi:hypothetical protein
MEGLFKSVLQCLDLPVKISSVFPDGSTVRAVVSVVKTERDGAFGDTGAGVS